MTHQVALTVTAEVAPDRRTGLDRLLEQLAAAPADNPVLPFGDLPHTHFARVVVLDRPAAGTSADTLVLTLDCDATVDERLNDLATLTGAGVDELFGACADYPRAPSPADRLAYLRDHLRDSQVFYAHAVGRTLDQVRDESRLRTAVEEFLDRELDRLTAMSPREIREELRGLVAREPSLSWALRPAPRPALSWRLRETAHKIAVPALLVLAIPLLVPGALVWLALLRWHERIDPFPEVEPDAARMRRLGDSEDYLVQNAFTSLAPIRPGRFWRLTSQLTLGVGNYTARHVFTQGSLSGLTTVHFARFMTFGPDRNLLFTSYYDGSLESYNNDFVDQVAWVLNTVFGQQEGYPRTRWMVKEGAHNERWFKNFIRGHQVTTQVWYSAYPHLSAATIDQNARLRAGLRGELAEEEVRAWLRIL